VTQVRLGLRNPRKKERKKQKERKKDNGCGFKTKKKRKKRSGPNSDLKINEIELN